MKIINLYGGPGTGMIEQLNLVLVLYEYMVCIT